MDRIIATIGWETVAVIALAVLIAGLICVLLLVLIELERQFKRSGR